MMEPAVVYEQRAVECERLASDTPTLGLERPCLHSRRISDARLKNFLKLHPRAGRSNGG
jgi:hypothetical protein